MKKILLLVSLFLFIVGCSEDTTTESSAAEVVNEGMKKEVKATASNDDSGTVSKEDNNDEPSATEEDTKNKEMYIKKLKDVEASIADLEEIVENGSQSEMNQAQGEIFKKWDAALNEVYGALEESLSKEKMDALREEQRKWIKERDAAAEAAADEYKGGSIEPFVYAASLTKWTKERTYELVENYMG